MKESTTWMIIAVLFSISAATQIFSLGVSYGKDECEKVEKK